MSAGEGLLGSMLAAAVVLGAAGVANAAFPGANGRIAFHSARDGAPAIWSMNANGTGQARLSTPTGDGDRYPSWSADGQRLAFSRCTLPGDCAIWRMNADGTSPAPVTTPPEDTNDARPTWSPDGTKIAFERCASTLCNIWVVAADGASPPSRLTASDEDRKPSWSPDGSRIAYEGPGGGGSDVFVIPATGGTPTPLAADATAADRRPSWSPDGTRVVFSSLRSGSGDIYVVNADGNGLTNLTPSGSDDDDWPAFSPDGSRIAFEKPNAGVWAMNANGSGQQLLSAGGTPTQDGAPDWQPLARLRPAPNVFGCQQRTLTVSGVVVQGCFSGSGPRYTARGPIAVDGIVLGPGLVRRPVGGLVVDTAAKTIATTAPGIEVHAFAHTPWDGELHELGRVTETTARRVVDLSKPVMLTATPPVDARVQGLPPIGDLVLRKTRTPGRAVLKGHARLPAMLGAGLGRISLTTTAQAGGLVAGPASVVQAPVAELANFTLFDLKLQLTRGGFLGRGRLDLLIFAAAAEIEIVDYGFRRGHAEVLNLLVPNTGLLVRKLTMDAYLINGNAEFVADTDLVIEPGLIGRPLVGLTGAARLLKSRDSPHWSLGIPHAGLSVVGIPLADASADVRHYYADLAGKVAFAAPGAGFDARLQGWAAWGARTGFSLEGSGTVSVLGSTLAGRGLLAANALAACGDVVVAVGNRSVATLSIGFASRFNPHHTTFFASNCDFGHLRPARPFESGAGGARGFTLPAGLPGALVAVRGTTAAPQVSLTGPRGLVAVGAGGNRVPRGGALAFSNPSERTTYLVIAQPAPGAWSVDAAPGSSPIASLRTADALPKPAVSVRVTGRGRSRTLVWRATPVPGQRIRFSEEGTGVRRTLGTTGRPRGAIRFSPAAGPGGRRRIVARFVRGGLPRASLAAGSYVAPPSPRLGAPARLVVRRSGRSVRATWRRRPDASHYEVRITARRLRPVVLLTRTPGMSFTGVAPGVPGRVVVRGIARDGRAGRGRAARLPLPRRQPRRR